MNEDLKTHGPAGKRELLAAQGAPTYSQNSSRENPAARADDSTGTWEFGFKLSTGKA
jgi:hypothetical protein